MRLRYSTDEAGTLWITNPVGSSQQFIARTWVRVVLLYPLMWLLLGGLLAAAGAGSIAFHPAFFIFLAVLLAAYVSKPKDVDGSIPLRLGFSREAMVLERLGGEKQTFPWSTVAGAVAVTGPLLGARLELSTAAGPVEIKMLNWDVAMRAVWGCRAGAAGTLEVSDLGETVPEAPQAASPAPTTAPVPGSESKLFIVGDALIYEKTPGHFVRLPRFEVDLHDFTMGSTSVLQVAWRGHRVVIIGPDDGIAAMRAWRAKDPSAATASGPGGAAPAPLAVARAVSDVVERKMGKARIEWETVRPDWPDPVPLSLPRGEPPEPLSAGPPWAINLDLATGKQRADAAIPQGGLSKAAAGWWVSPAVDRSVPKMIWGMSAFMFVMGLFVVSLGASRGRFTYDLVVIPTVFFGAAVVMPLALKKNADDLWNRKSRSFMRVDLGTASVGQVAAAIDAAMRSVCPEAKCSVPYMLAEGYWTQRPSKVDVSFYTKDTNWGIHVELRAVRSRPVVAAIKGAIVRALYAGADLRSPEEVELLRAAGRSAAATPDPPGSLLQTLGHLFIMGVLAVALGLFGFLTLFLIWGLVFEPLVGARPAGSASDYFGIFMALGLTALLGLVFYGSMEGRPGPKREWPEGWARAPASNKRAARP